MNHIQPPPQSHIVQYGINYKVSLTLEKFDIHTALIRLCLFLLLLETTKIFPQVDGHFYRIKSKWSRAVDNILPVDADLDGNDEFLIKHSNQYDLQDFTLEHYYKSFHLNLTGPHSIQLIPSNKMDSIYFFINIYHKNKSQYSILEPTPLTIGKSIEKNVLRDFFYLKNNETTNPDFRQSLRYLQDFSTPNGRLGLFEARTAWDQSGTRGVYAIDYKNGQVMWQFTFGPQLIHHQLLDIDKDGSNEILLSTYASNNDVTGQSFDDSSAYLFMLNCHGDLLWKRRLGDYWSGVFAHGGSFFGDKSENIAVIQFSRREDDPNQDRIYLLDIKTGTTIYEKRYGKRFRVAHFMRSSICHDMDGDGRKEIITGNSDGYVRVFDGYLNIELQSEKYNDSIIFAGVADLTGDAIPEVICHIRDKKIIVLNNKLVELCRYEHEPSTLMNSNIVFTNEHAYILVTQNMPNHIQATLLDLQQSIFPFPQSGNDNKINTLVLLFLPAVIAVGFVVYRQQMDRQMMHILLMLPDIKTNLLVIDKTRHIRFIGTAWQNKFAPNDMNPVGQKINKIFSMDTIKNAVEKLLDGKTTNKNTITWQENGSSFEIQAIRSKFPHLVILFLTDLAETEHIKQVKMWALVAQQLAHGIKNPLTSVKLNAQELKNLLQQQNVKSKDDVNEYIDTITSQVTRLKRMTDGFMRFVEFEKPLLKPKNINKLTTQLIETWYTEKWRNIRIDWELDKKCPPVLIDVTQYTFALKSIFYNAVESIEKKGSISISSSIAKVFDVEKGLTTWIELTIQDTGKGIPPEYLEKIKQPYFTLKSEGTGLGLSIVEKIMQSHNGELEIKSRIDDGTTVILRFRTAL